MARAAVGWRGVIAGRPFLRYLRPAMMTKAERLASWMEVAADQWVCAQSLNERASYGGALFWAFMTIKSLGQSVWLREHTNGLPPRRPRLGKLLAATSFHPTTEQLTLLADLDHWRKDTIEPDPEDPFRNRATAEYTRNFLLETNHLRETLLAHLA